MVMSLVAMAGGIILYLLLRKPLKHERITAPPLVGRLNGKRFLSAVRL